MPAGSVQPPDWMRRRLPFHLYRIAFLVWFVKGLLRLRPDVVHAHDAAMLLPGIIGARLTGARLIYDSHELATSVPYRERAWAWFVAAIERVVVPRCTAVITVSDGIAQRLRARYRLSGRSPRSCATPASSSRGSPAGCDRQMGLDADHPPGASSGAPAPARGCEVLLRPRRGSRACTSPSSEIPRRAMGSGSRGPMHRSGLADRVLAAR